MNRKTILRALTFVSITVSLAACSTATNSSSSTSENTSTKNTLAEIKKRDRIVIGVKTDYTPYAFIDANSKNAGLEIDIARYLTKEILGSDTKVEFVPVVASNRIQLLKQGKIDLVIATMTITEERRKEIEFSEPYYAAGTGLLTRKNSGISTWESLKGKKVCGIQGSFYNKDLTNMGIEMVNFPGTAEAYTALKDGRCLGFAYDDSALAGKLLEPSWSGDWHQPLPVIFSKPWGMGIRKGDAVLLKTVNDAILKMEAEGFVVKGEQKWKIPATDYVKERMEKAQKKP
jgi:polar amino acid transport system substrate-binding protein